MRGRRALALVFGIVLAAGAITLYSLPQIARRVTVARIQALTQRPVSIDAVELSLLTGRATVRGFRLGERDGATPFADFERLDVRLHLPSLLLGHLWIRELVLSDSTVRVVRRPTGEFNFSDLIRASATTNRALDVTVDRFALARGTVTLEDRALPESRTWASEQITIEARGLSTRQGGGSAVGRSVTVGAPVSVVVEDLRLHPIHLRATVTMEGVDLTPLRIYFPPDATVVLARGRASSSITVALDAREGLQVDATARFEDVALARPDGSEPLAVVPALTAEIAGLGVRDDDRQLARLAVEGTMSVRDPSAGPGVRYPLSTIRASVSDLTWPARTPGRVDVLTSVPGGGRLTIAGTVRPPPAASQLHLRLVNLNLAPWAQFVPLAARVTGLAEANLEINEPLAAGVPARIEGSIAVNRITVADDRRELLGAQRVEARGLEVHWPSRLAVKRVLVSGPRAVVERDVAGAFPLTRLAIAGAPGAGPARPATRPTPGVEVTEVAVRDGRLHWRDETVSPAARLTVSNIDATLTEVGWPLRGPLGVRAALRPPGGGQLRLSGRVELEPLSTELRVVAKNAELAPYQPYVPTAARISGAADLDVSLVVPPLAERRATVRGSAALSRVDVQDGERTVARVERATATGIELDWPQRLAIGQLALARPWLLLERDPRGELPLRGLLALPAGAGGHAAAGSVKNGAETIAVTVAKISADEGGVRVVDRAVSPPFAVDVQPATLRVEGFSTLPAPPARVDLTGMVGAASELALRGTVAAFGGPLRLDVSGELREFAVPRTNPYLLRQVGWQSREGRLTTTLQCRIDGDALSARTQVRLSRLQLVPASSRDEAQARIGLPLGLITTLLKDRRGDITVAFPVGGRLSDPRFDFRETLWGAIRTVAVNAITLPVSWIGRVHFTPDSRIERIQVDPVPFEPGTATPTPEGRARMTRLVAFLDQLPEARMTLTPVVSSRDVEEIKRLGVEAAIDRAAQEGRVSREDAVTRLIAQHFPGRPAPATPEAAVAALLERTPMPTAEVPELAARRLQAMRATARQAGIDSARFAGTEVAQREGGPGQVELEVVEAEGPRPSKLRETLRKLGVPLKGAGE
ncbi:MAG TPA: DUF748 domain-containing protein [Methylomirabilota bacterium]|nr:DUF748 domain-containing protein [Methylomirabilota bacterium]